MQKRVQYIIIAILCLLFALSAVLIPLYFTGVIGKEPEINLVQDVKQEDPLKNATFQAYSVTSLPEGQYAVFTIVYNNKEYSIKYYLLDQCAPKTVENFVKYVKDGLYNNTVFYKSDITYYEDTGKPSSAYIQGGAYMVNGDGEPVKKTPDHYYGKLEGEFYANDPESKNDISFVGGVLGMVRENANDYNSADTEFFLLSYAMPELNGYYAAFGVAVESDATTDLYTLTKALNDADGTYPVVIKEVKIYTRKK